MRANLPASKARAFTLIELMVVIVIIGIMTAMIIPEMRGTYQDAVLRSASRDLLNGFDLAYSQAVSQNQTHRIRLDRAKNRYIIERKVHEGTQSGDEFMPAREIPGSSEILDPRVTIEFKNSGEGGEPEAGSQPPLTDGAGSDSKTPNNSESFSFYPDGTADAGEAILQDRDGFRLALRINPVTSRVHLVQLDRK